MTIKEIDLDILYLELRREIDFLAKAKASEEDSKYTLFPDPAQLTQIERRVLIKSVFSFIEAVVYGIKWLALDHFASGILSRGERLLAEEEEYQLSENGLVLTRSARLRFVSNLRFAFHILTKVSQVEFKLDE